MIFRSGQIILATLALVGFLYAGTPAPVQAQSPDVEHGRALAELNCGRCHATGLEGESDHSLAPPFWSLSDRRPVETVSEMLLRRTTPNDSDMPHFAITKKQADDLAAWIAWVQPIAHGKRFVERNCARCHAIGKSDKSKHSNAPPFREISTYYPLDGLEEGFAEGIVTGHPDMPVFTLEPLEIADVIAYMESLKE